MTLFIQDEQKGDAMIYEALQEIECLQKMKSVAEFCSQDFKITPFSSIMANHAIEMVMP
ncbi:MAG: hypothetical protein KJ990_02640 [Proteobacteria bacterium]|nr:hypothetical protein [Pseudomonadota bacterium]MBU1648690.1 hypothetical protein [Pseudomonadota bacterium]